jgi:hypothetical protein
MEFELKLKQCLQRVQVAQQQGAIFMGRPQNSPFYDPLQLYPLLSQFAEPPLPSVQDVCISEFLRILFRIIIPRQYFHILIQIFRTYVNSSKARDFADFRLINMALNLLDQTARVWVEHFQL